jgi:anti-sigma B factor antagonist
MEFTKNQIRPGVVILAMTGSIRIGPNCQQIEKALDEIIRQDGPWVVFDLTHVTFIDSAGIGTVIRGLIKLRKLGGTLRLAGVTGMVEGVLKLTRIDRTIEIFPTAEEAAQGLPLASKS